MAKKKKKEPEKPVNLGSLFTTLNAQYGAQTMVPASQIRYDPPRLPTGIFALDFAAGGGLPLHGSTCAWGPDQGGKSRITIAAMRIASMICWRCFNLLETCTCHKPKPMKSVLVDIEGTTDAQWLEACGVPKDSYYYILCDSGEQYVNVSESVLRADDCGLLVVDSLAALVPESEFDAPMEQEFMALQARLIGRAVKRIKQRHIRERKKYHACTVLFTNQMRMKVGVSFGDPEVMPGGFSMKHEFSLLVRIAKKMLDKNGTDAKYINEVYNKAMASRHSFALKKEKIATLAGAGEFIVVKESIPELELEKGMIDDYGSVLKFGKELGIIVKDDAAKVWRVNVNGKKMKAAKQDDLKLYWKKNFPVYLATQQAIIQAAKGARHGGGSCQM